MAELTRDDLITFMDAMLFSMEGDSPSKAIERQEARGQQSVVRNKRLPKKLNDHSVPYDIRWKGLEDDKSWEERHEIFTKNNIEYTKQQYEKMGITIVDECDDLFWNVVLPEGWTIKATDHTMWNNLFDDKGRKRANFFYKAAFYDRDAFINFDTRYHLRVEHVADFDTTDYEEWKKSDYQGFVKDGEEIIHSTSTYPATGEYKIDDKTEKALWEYLENYMKENYPDWENINAYWD